MSSTWTAKSLAGANVVPVVFATVSLVFFVVFFVMLFVVMMMMSMECSFGEHCMCYYCGSCGENVKRE